MKDTMFQLSMGEQLGELIIGCFGMLCSVLLKGNLWQWTSIMFLISVLANLLTIRGTFKSLKTLHEGNLKGGLSSALTVRITAWAMHVYFYIGSGMLAAEIIRSAY